MIRIALLEVGTQAKLASWLANWLASCTYVLSTGGGSGRCCCCSIATAQRYGSTMRVCAIKGVKQDGGVHECLKK